MNWHSAELRCTKLALICKMLLKDLLKLARFQNQCRRRGSLTPTASLKVLSSSLLGLQGHSFQNALEMIILFKLCVCILVQERSIPLGVFLHSTTENPLVLGQEWSCGRAVPSRGAAGLCTEGECLIIRDAGALLPPPPPPWMANKFQVGFKETGTAPLSSSMASVLATSPASPSPCTILTQLCSVDPTVLEHPQ